MAFPFVSRERFDELKKQLADTEAERKRLLEFLMRREPAQAPVQSVSVEEDQRSSHKMTGFTTPIDKVLNDFDRARKNGPIPETFKARAR